jgi:uncharacterized protein (TIGR02246 family)
MTRIIVIVILALVVASATSASAGQRSPSEDMRALVERYWAAWGTGNPDNAAPLYAKDAALVFYDLEPVKWVGWEQYAAGVGPSILSKFSSIAFSVNPDLVARRQGDSAWTAVTVDANGVLKAGGPIRVTIRHTAIWERRGSQWLIVHEHVSVPSTLPAAPGSR